MVRKYNKEIKMNTLYSLNNVMNGSIDNAMGISFITSINENIEILNKVIIKLSEGKTDVVILAHLVVEYGQEYEPLIQNIIKAYSGASI